MDEGFETSVDTYDLDCASSDVANEAPIEETSDIESDIPEDVVDDTPIEEASDMESDIPEDVEDDAPIEEISDMESDIPEDVVDDAPSEETSDMESDIPEDEVDEMPMGNSINDTSEMPDDLQSEEDLNDIAENDETVSNDASGTEDELVAEDELGNEIEDQIAESETGNVVEEQPAGNEKNQLEEGSDILNNGEFSEIESAEDETNPNEAETTEEVNGNSQLEEVSDTLYNGEFSDSESAEDEANSNEAEITEEENKDNRLEEGVDILNNGEFNDNESAESDAENETEDQIVASETCTEDDSAAGDVSVIDKKPEVSCEQVNGEVQDGYSEPTEDVLFSSTEGEHLNDAIEMSVKGIISDFFTGIFGGGAKNDVISVTDNNSSTVNSTTDMQEETPKSEDSVVADHVPTWTERVNSIENMNYNDLSSADKDIMYQMSKDHIGSKYGDLIEVDRINDIPNHIKIANTDECRKAYETSGSKYSDNTLGFYNPRTDEIYVDAPRNGDMTEIMATVVHESLHLVSKGGLNGDLKDMTGNSSYRRSTNLNEGVTELLAMKDMSDMGFNYNSSSYQEQVKVAKALEEAMGSDLIRKAYFTNQPELIRSKFDEAFATEPERAALPLGDSICNGKYIEFLDAFDRFISTEPSNSNYVTNRNNVYNLIGQYKAKRGLQ